MFLNILLTIDLGIHKYPLTTGFGVILSIIYIHNIIYIADLDNAVQATREFIAKHSSLPGCVVGPQISTNNR